MFTVVTRPMTLGLEKPRCGHRLSRIIHYCSVERGTRECRSDIHVTDMLGFNFVIFDFFYLMILGG